MQEIIITIKPDGAVIVEGEGFQGSDCLNKALPFYKELGQVTSTQAKEAYFQEATIEQGIRQ